MVSTCTRVPVQMILGQLFQTPTALIHPTAGGWRRIHPFVNQLLIHRPIHPCVHSSITFHIYPAIPTPSSINQLIQYLICHSFNPTCIHTSHSSTPIHSSINHPRIHSAFHPSVIRTTIPSLYVRSSINLSPEGKGDIFYLMANFSPTVFGL